MNRPKPFGEVWYGGVVRARLYDPQGRHRPEIAAWMTEAGWLIGARAVPPGQGSRALGELLDAALKQRRVTRPRELALETPSLLVELRARTDVPLRQGSHWGFSLVLEDNLPAIGGLGFEQGYVDRGVSLPLIRELFDAARRFAALDLIRLDRPQLCAIELGEVGSRAVWIGDEPSVVGNGLRLFRDLDAYRDYMHVNVACDWVWSDGDDASVLGLASEHVRRLNKKQRRDLERHRLALPAPGIAPIVIATDAEDVDRPFGADDVRQLVSATRAICAAFESGQPEFRGEVSCLGETQQAQVRLRHPDATDTDLGLTCIPDSDVFDALISPS